MADKTSQNMEVPQGTVIPPPEIRKVVETTVAYILRNGMSFANRIREREDGNVRFAFLREGDAYHDFYLWRLGEYRAGRGVPTGPGDGARESESPAVEEKQNDKIKKPHKFEFSGDLPPISSQDLEIIKLTALFAAQNGQQFITSLGHKETKNFQFDFLKPNHSLFSLFNSYVRQYKRVLTPDSYITQMIERGLGNKYDILKGARIRAEWASFKEEKDKKALAAAEKERIAYAEIDWHDFFVVETVEFTNQDKSIDLPGPVSLAQLQFASLEQKRSGSYMIEEAPPDYEPEEHLNLSSVDPEVSESQTTTAASVPPEPATPTPETGKGSKKIRAAGTRRQPVKTPKEHMVVSPLTGELVSQSQYDEHMRISLLDPKWKEQRAVEEARRAGTNLPPNEVDLNLKRMASARPDIFDAHQDSERPKRPRRAGPGAK
jgi:splicing factor 3A subunit 1